MSLTDIGAEQVRGSVPVRAITLTRIMLGTAALLKLTDAWQLLRRLESPGILRVPFADELVRWPLGAANSFLMVWGVAAAAFTVGWRPGLSGAALVVAMFAVLVSDQQLYSNHLYLLCLLVGLVTAASAGRPSGRYSGPPIPAPMWPVFLLRCQLTIVYGFAAVSKLNPAYLSGGLIGSNLPDAGLPYFPLAWYRVEVLSPMAVAAVLVELFLAVAFWLPDRRRIAVIIGISLHVGMIALLSHALGVQLVVFALAMWSLYPLFFIRSAEVTSQASDAPRELPGAAHPMSGP